jgi:transposase
MHTVTDSGPGLRLSTRTEHGHVIVTLSGVLDTVSAPALREQLLDLLRTSCKAQVHAVLAKLGVPVTCSDIFGVAGSAWLDGLGLPQPYGGKVTSLRQLAGELSTQISMLSEVIADLLACDRGYRVIQQLPGIGPVLAAVITAEIGDVRRFKTAAQLCSWAGLTPRHHESDTKVTRGHVTKQGSRILRWALIEAIQRVPGDSVIGSAKEAIITRRGKEARNIAKVAAARRLLTLVFYGLRDGQIRCLDAGAPRAAQPPARAA